MRREFLVLLLSFCLVLAGCTSDDSGVNDSSVDNAEMPETFPEWDELTDDGTNWSSTKLDGQAYIVVFSAQWCNSPCFNLMHTIWDAQSELPVMVMSTDNGSEVSFEDWHDSADAYDDEGDEPTITLTSYKFLLGDEEGQELGIDITWYNHVRKQSW